MTTCVFSMCILVRCIEWRASLCPQSPLPLMASCQSQRATPRPARSAGQIHAIACAKGLSRNLAMRQTLPQLLPVSVEHQFDDPTPSATLRPHSNARPIHLAPSTSIQFIGTMSSPCSPLSLAHPTLPCYCLTSVADAVTPPRPSSYLSCAYDQTYSARI